MEHAEHRGYQVAADRGARTDRQLAATQPQQGGELELGGVLDREDPSGVLGERATGHGQPDSARQAIDQPDAERSLEITELLRDRRLTDLQALRGARDAAGDRDRVERPQVVQVERSAR
jgi:hypothetical protein